MPVESAFVGALGLDTDTKLDADSARRLCDWGFRFAIRYLSLGQPHPSDLTSNETQEIINAGLALMAVQHTRMPGWIPNANLGVADGGYAAHNAITAGLPSGVSVCCDLEGVAAGANAKDVMAYCNAWDEAVSAAGYLPVLYVGGACGLTADELYALRFTRYWKSQSLVPEVTRRGFCMIQLFPSVTIAGVSVDVNVVQQDYQGGVPKWLVAPPHATTLPADDTLDDADTPAIT
jgi:hypothetical protein